MSNTLRTVAVPGKPPHIAAEGHRFRVEREQRVARKSRAAKVLARADRYAERREVS